MDFQSEKSFEKLRHRAFQPYHQILCILKHVGDVGDRSSTPKGCNAMYVGDVGDRNNLQYTQDLIVWLKSPKAQLSKTFFWIENPLNIKQVMSRNVSDNNNAAMLLMAHVGDVGDVKYLNKRSKATLYRTMLPMLPSIEIFHISDISNIAVYSVAFDHLLRYFTSPTSPTCIALILCIDYID